MLAQQPNMKAGDEFFLIESEWYQKWRTYVGYDALEGAETGGRDIEEHAQHPGKISNTSIINSSAVKGFKQLMSS